MLTLLSYSFFLTFQSSQNICEAFDNMDKLETGQILKDEANLPLSVQPAPNEILMTWDGPAGPANPKHWSQTSRILNVGIVSAIVFLT